MTQGIESGVGHVWQTPQSAAGTIERADATTIRHLRKVGDDALAPAKTYGSEEWADGATWSSPTSYVESIGGAVGSLTAQVTIEDAAFLWAQLLSVDVVSGDGDPYTHTISSGTPVPALQTYYQTVGDQIGPIQQAWWDAKITRLTQNVGQDQIPMHLQQDVIALHAADWTTSLPTATDAGIDPLTWHEGTTRINGTTLEEIRGDTIEADARLDVHRGQHASPACFVYSKGEIARTVDGIVTDRTLPAILTVLYGTATPADRQAVSSRVEYASIATSYVREAGRRTLDITTPRVEIRPDDWAFGPRAEGGEMPVAFGGRCHASSRTPAITIVARTGDADAYV